MGEKVRKEQGRAKVPEGRGRGKIPAQRGKANRRERERIRPKEKAKAKGRAKPKERMNRQEKVRSAKGRVITTSHGERASPKARLTIIGTAATADRTIITHRCEVAVVENPAVGTLITTRGGITVVQKVKARAGHRREVAVVANPAAVGTLI